MQDLGWTPVTATSARNPARFPLEGVRVLEFAHVAAGPFAGMLLADMGADVVKVEPPSGDQMRGWPPLAYAEDGKSFSHNFASINRNKRSIVADLKDPQQLARVQKLCAEADVLMENYRPGVLDRLGLGYDQLSQDHRGLVYCSISGYGLSSPNAQRGAYDVVIQGMSGLMSVTGPAGGDPVKCGVPVGDFIAGLYAAYTTAAMLPGVRDSGQSVHIDCPMLDCLIATSALQTSEYWGSGIEPRAMGSAHPRNAPYQAFQASDRMFVVAAGNDRLWHGVCMATDSEHLITDPRFTTQSQRVAHQDQLAAVLQERFSTKPAEYWLVELERQAVPCGPVNTFGDVLADPHIHATGLVREIDVPIAGKVPTVVFPARVSGLPSRLEHCPPTLGADTEDVFTEWGIA